MGTDFPLAQEIGVASTLSGLARHQGFDDADRRAIESDNARRLFPRLALLELEARELRARREVELPEDVA